MAAERSRQAYTQVMEIKNGSIQWRHNTAILTRQRKRTIISYRIVTTLFLPEREGSYYRFSHIRYERKKQPLGMSINVDNDRLYVIVASIPPYKIYANLIDTHVPL